MAKHEPATLDIHGATWTGKQDYELDPTAKRYEVYEMSMSAKVSLDQLTLAQGLCLVSNVDHCNICTIKL